MYRNMAEDHKYATLDTLKIEYNYDNILDDELNNLLQIKTDDDKNNIIKNESEINNKNYAIQNSLIQLKTEEELEFETLKIKYNFDDILDDESNNSLKIKINDDSNKINENESELNNINYSIENTLIQLKTEEELECKIGDVFIKNGKIFLECNFCNERIEKLIELKEHIIKHHFNINSFSEQEDFKETETKEEIPKENLNLSYKKQEVDEISSNNIDYDSDKDMAVEKISQFNFKDLNLENEIESKFEKTKYYSSDTSTNLQDDEKYFSILNSKTNFELNKNHEKETNESTNSKDRIKLRITFDNQKYSNNHDKISTRTNIMLKSCTVCSATFNSDLELRIHLVNIHGKHKCPYKKCGKLFRDRYSLDMHICTHTGEKKFECRYCDYKCIHVSNLKNHMNTHFGIKPFSCDYCEKTFTQKIQKTIHERVIHTKNLPFNCDICDKKYATKPLLNFHIKRCHTSERPFHCEHCEKGFVTATQLKIHMICHNKTEHFHCYLCNKFLTRELSLKRHLRTLHGL